MSMPAEILGLRGCLDQLFQGIAQMPAIEIAGLSSDSRKLGKEHLFLAVQGATSHGLDFLRQVEAVGAAAVVFDSSTGVAVPKSSLPVIGVEGLAGYLGEIANRWYGSPSKQMRVTGVTGTNGKTSTSYLLEGIGEDFLPTTMNFDYVDDVIRVNDKEWAETHGFLPGNEAAVNEGPVFSASWSRTKPEAN